MPEQLRAIVLHCFARQEPVLFIALPPAGACFLAVSDFGSLTGMPEQLRAIVLHCFPTPVEILAC
jgi:hypothetical protein